MQENLSLYHIFYTVSRTGNISSAAKELYISQPAISRAIKKLENNLDTTLFKRSSRGVTLTPDGQILYEKKKQRSLRPSFEGEDSILHNRSREIPRLRIGAKHHFMQICTYAQAERFHCCQSANPYYNLLPVYLPDLETSWREERQNRHRPDRTTAEAIRIRIFAPVADPGYLCRYTPIPGESAPGFSIRTLPFACYFHAC